MIVTPIKTTVVLPNSTTLIDLISSNITDIKEGSILAIASKVVSLCENRVKSMNLYDKTDLVQQESDRFTDTVGSYGFHFTITKNILIPSAGIDESNGNGDFILWPSDPQKSANNIRKQIKEFYGLKNIGIIITDSNLTPLRHGTVGIALAHSGFAALNDYVGQPDLFGRPFTVSTADIAGGLAGAAVLVSGEGNEQTPLCLIEDVNFVKFQDRDPLVPELAELIMEPKEDLFAPLIDGVKWNQGLSGNSDIDSSKS